MNDVERLAALLTVAILGERDAMGMTANQAEEVASRWSARLIAAGVRVDEGNKSIPLNPPRPSDLPPVINTQDPERLDGWTKRMIHPSYLDSIMEMYDEQ